MSNFGGCRNGLQACGNGVNNCGGGNYGTGSGNQNFGQGSGSNHVSGGMLTANPGFTGPCAPGMANPCAPGVNGPCAYPYGAAPVNLGPGSGGWNGGSASGSLNHFNRQANIGCKHLC